MKPFLTALALAGWLAQTVDAQAPLRALVLDFQNQAGQRADVLLGGAVPPEVLAEKGVFLLGKALANRPGFTLVDRRDFLQQVERLRPMDDGRSTPTRPSFLQAAQALRADVLLRGTLLSASPGKQMIRQGGYDTELATLSVRVGLEALDARDGSVIAVKDGVARRTFRQTEALKTALSEDELYEMMEEALAQAAPAIEEALLARAAAERSRPTVQLSISTSADPALVEIDGILIGATPIEGFQLYKGDHVLTVTRPGYQQVTKRILLESDTRLDIPLLREQLTAEELKEIYEKMQLNVIRVEPGLLINATP